MWPGLGPSGVSAAPQHTHCLGSQHRVKSSRSLASVPSPQGQREPQLELPPPGGPGEDGLEPTVPGGLSVVSRPIGTWFMPQIHLPRRSICGFLPGQAVLQAMPLTTGSARAVSGHRPRRAPGPGEATSTLRAPPRPGRAPACGFPCRGPTWSKLASRSLQVRPPEQLVVGGRVLCGGSPRQVSGRGWEQPPCPPGRKLVALGLPVGTWHQHLHSNVFYFGGR